MNRLRFTIYLAVIAALLLAPGALAQEGDPVEVDFTGTVTAVDLDQGTFLVEDDTGEVFTVFPPEGFDLTGLEVGDIVEVEGTLAEDGSVLATKVEVQPAEDDEPGEGEDGDADEGEDGEADDGEDGEADENGVNFFCRADTEEQHPVGAGIAEVYGVDYEQVMSWFCDGGFGFGQIMLALMTQEKTGTSADELLGRRAGGEGWGQIWVDMQLIGKPSDAEPPGGPKAFGKPENAGPPDWAGRPEDSGPPDWAGRPEDAGPPDWAGRPDDAGPPDWAGRPEGAGRPPWAGP